MKQDYDIPRRNDKQKVWVAETGAETMRRRIGKGVQDRPYYAQFPGGAHAGWWLKTVQLDLEAKRIIVREKTTPLRLHRS